MFSTFKKFITNQKKYYPLLLLNIYWLTTLYIPVYVVDPLVKLVSGQ